MLAIELARHLDDYARGDLSDTLTRNSTSPAATFALVAVTVATTSDPHPTTTAGTYVCLLDNDTAVALARGGLLLRKPHHRRTFGPATPEQVALQRDRQQLLTYLETAEQLVADSRR